MRIAHITDLHVARSPSVGDCNPKRVLGYVNYCLFRSRRYRESVAANALARLMDNPPELVLLTGDITQHGLASEFDAAEALLSVVTEQGIPIIAVPGNHDIYGHGDRGRLHTFLGTVSAGVRPDAQGVFHFPGVEILPLHQGIPTPLFFSHGRQERDELERAAEEWKRPPDGVMRLVCGHYPVIDPHGGKLVYFHGLRGADLLMDFCRDHKVAGYFCGHNHKRFAADMAGGCRQFAAPSLSDVRDAEKEWISVYRCGPDMAHPQDERSTGAANG